VVDEDVRVNFIEVFSEQKIRLLVMGVEKLPPDGPGERAARVTLSDQRLLDLTLRFASPSPTIQVVYSDPYFHEALDPATAIEVVPVAPVLDQQPVSSPTERPADEKPNQPLRSSKATPARAGAPCSPLLGKVYRALTSSAFWARPQTVTAFFALLLVGGLIYLSLPTRVTKLSAPELLSQAAAAEEVLGGRTDLVLHSTFNLEEREPAGKVLSRRRVEVWHSAAKGITARRLYDESGRLVSGEWVKAGGASSLYRSNHAQSQPQIDVHNQQTAPHSVELWQLSPSAKDFLTLTADGQPAGVEERDGLYVVSYDQDGARNAGSGVVKATLTLSRADLHATELMLVVPADNSNPQSAIRNPTFVEYRFTESAFERRAPDSVAPSVFEPDSELVVPPAAESDPHHLKPETEAPGSQPPTPVLATADLEAEVLRLLNQAGADMDDQTNVSRTSDGKLLVSGVVETADRKMEILRALAPVISHAALTVKIETVAEVVSRQKRSPSSEGPVSVQRVEVTKANIPVYQDLRRYLGGNKEAAKEDSQADEQVRQFAATILNRSRLIMSEAGTLKRLAGQFSAEDLRSMSPDARAKWQAVIRAHARNCEQETRRLRQELQPIFFPGASSVIEIDQTEIKDDASLARAATRLFDLVSANDRVIRSAFTISAEPTATTAIRSPQFWELLKSAEGLAAKISKQ
jgi:hypothetical protein